MVSSHTECGGFCCRFMPSVQRVLGCIQWQRQHLQYIWFSSLPLRQKALSLIKHLVLICVRPTFAVVTEKRFVPKSARVYKHMSSTYTHAYGN